MPAVSADAISFLPVGCLLGSTATLFGSLAIFLVGRPLGFALPPRDGFALLAAVPVKRYLCLLSLMAVNNEDVKG